jgi:hypothetical protein
MSTATDLAKLFIKYGSPLAPVLLGPGAGAAVVTATKMLAPILGVENEEELQEKMQSDPEAVEEAIRNNVSDIKFNEDFATKYHFEVESLKQIHETMRLEIKSESWIARNWRPLHAIEFTLEMAGFAYLSFIMLERGGIHAKEFVTNLSAMWIILTGYGSIRLTLLGLHLVGRTQEKIAEKGNISGTIANAIKKAVVK